MPHFLSPRPMQLHARCPPRRGTGGGTPAVSRIRSHPDAADQRSGAVTGCLLVLRGAARMRVLSRRPTEHSALDVRSTPLWLARSTRFYPKSISSPVTSPSAEAPGRSPLLVSLPAVWRGRRHHPPMRRISIAHSAGIQLNNIYLVTDDQPGCQSKETREPR